MWINKNIFDRTKSTGNTTCGNVTSVCDKTVNISSDSQCYNLPLVAPCGIAYVPQNGSSTVVLPVGKDQVCIGGIVPKKDLQPGEIMLYSSGGAVLILKNDGSIIANNKVIA